MWHATSGVRGMTYAGVVPMASDHCCSECGEPYTLTRKWNGGNPIDVWLSTCDCDDAGMDEYIERLAERLAARRAALG